MPEFVDPYTYPGSDVLKNKLGIRDAVALQEAEYEIHRHLFQDLFDWAGELRTVDITKGSSRFHPALLLDTAAEYLTSWLEDSRLASTRRLFDERFVQQASELMALLNDMHPFREGNGRTQRAFLDHVAAVSGRRLAWRNITEHEHIRASIESFNSHRGKPFEPVFERLIQPPIDGLGHLDSRVYTASAPNVAAPSIPPQPAKPAARGRCGAETARGTSCRRTGRCPHHEANDR